jgi:hypothetical protein
MGRGWDLKKETRNFEKKKEGEDENIDKSP